MESPGEGRNKLASSKGRERSLMVRACIFVSSSALLAMMLVTVSEVAARSLFKTSFDMSEEFGGYLLVAITFISIPSAYANSSFHQVEFLRRRLGERGRSVLGLGFQFVSLMACTIIAWRLVQFEIFSYRSGAVSETSLATPLWIPQLSMPIGMIIFCWLLGTDFLHMLRSTFAAFAHPEKDEE